MQKQKKKLAIDKPKTRALTSEQLQSTQGGGGLDDIVPKVIEGFKG